MQLLIQRVYVDSCQPRKKNLIYPLYTKAQFDWQIKYWYLEKKSKQLKIKIIKILFASLIFLQSKY